jgi:hypothetical protein
MASFIGTHQEFRRYIGPMLRNLVHQITKIHKAEISACEHCGSKENLESAHVKDRDRNEIIDFILKEFTTNEVITVNLRVFEKKFKEEHHPIEKSILILCRNCHRLYDEPEPSIPKQKILKSESSASNKQKELKVAYYLSRFEHGKLGLGNQGKTFAECSRILSVKPNTLKNYRDFFDSHCNVYKQANKREGWKKPMSEDIKTVYDYFHTMTENNILQEIKTILLEEQNAQSK